MPSGLVVSVNGFSVTKCVRLVIVMVIDVCTLCGGLYMCVAVLCMCNVCVLAYMRLLVYIIVGSKPHKHPPFDMEICQLKHPAP